jgi:hypothetical protein
MVVRFEEEMKAILHGSYGLSKEDAAACFASCRPDLRRELLELRLVDTRGVILRERYKTCPLDKFVLSDQAVETLVSTWLAHRRRSHPSH